MNRLDKLIDLSLHPESNGLLIREKVAEGASHEWLIKRELKQAILTWAEEEIVGENDKPKTITDDFIDSSGVDERNNLRADQRQKLKSMKTEQ